MPVLAMLVQVVPPLIDFSQRVTFPVLPDKVKIPLLAPEQTVVPPLTVPPTLIGLTVIVAAAEKAALQVPFCACNLNFVVVVKLVLAGHTGTVQNCES